MEALASGPAIAELGGVPAYEIFHLFRAGQGAATNLEEQAARIFARGLVNLTCVLDTRLIVVGDGVARIN